MNQLTIPPSCAFSFADLMRTTFAKRLPAGKVRFFDELPKALSTVPLPSVWNFNSRIVDDEVYTGDSTEDWSRSYG